MTALVGVVVVAIPARALADTTAPKVTENTGADSTSGQELFAFLKSYFDESVERARSLQTVVADRSTRLAERDAALSRFLPMATLSGGTQRTLSFIYQGGKRTNVLDRPAQTYDMTLGLKENLWAGGTDRLTLEGSETNLAAQDIDIENASRALRVSLAKDVLDLLNQSRIVKRKREELDEAKTVSDISERKFKGGFLGAKDALDSRRETLRAETDARNVADILRKNVDIFNTKYRLVNARLSVDALVGLETAIESVLTKGAERLKDSGFRDDIARSSLFLKRSDASRKAQEIATERTRRLALGPSIDLTAGVNGSTTDKTSLPLFERSLVPDYQWAWQARLGFSVNVYNPQGSAQTEVERSRFQRIETERAAFLDALDQRARNLVTEHATLVARLADLRKLVDISKDLKEKSARLFEAGETDVLHVLVSEQDLSAAMENLVTAENDLRNLELELMLDLAFGFQTS